MSMFGKTSRIKRLNICESENVNLLKTLIRIAFINIDVSSSYDATFPSFK